MSSQDRAQELLNWLQNESGFAAQNFHLISGDASFRKYYRFSHNEQNLIAVDAPPPMEDCGKFIDIAQSYLSYHVPVPKVLAADIEQGFMCLEDFGDVMLSHKLESEDIFLWYSKAISHLAQIQNATATELGPLPTFDDALLESEFHLFNHWLLEVHLGLELTETQWRVIHEAQKYLAEAFKAQPQVGVHRDYHSRNLMIVNDEQVGIIDFQDAVVGPVTYDIVSLLRDCYVVWSDDFVTQLLQNWHQQCYSSVPWPEFRHWFDCTGLQRHIKASGIFARLWHRDGKAGYLNDIPRTLQYIVTVGKQVEECTKLAELVEEIVIPAVLAKASEAERRDN